MSGTAEHTLPRPRIVRDVILRDGSTLRLRSPEPDDFDALKAFFDALDPESRYLRFHGYARTDAAARMYAESDGDSRVTFVGHLGERIVAVAGYERLRDPGAAEVAFAVADDLQGRGIATRLLEQLADHAVAGGVRRFDAEVLTQNRAMLGVFRNAGFRIRREVEGEETHLSLDLSETAELEARMAERDHLATVASLRPLLTPRSVAVVGASRDPGSVGAGLFSSIVGGGFAGVAVPVNRSGSVVGSVRAVERVSALDEPPDLAVLAVPAAEVIDAARDAAAAGVKALVVVASGFSERGDEGRALEEELLAVVRSSGMRLVGPNSLGVVSNLADVSLHATVGPLEVRPGSLALSSQSGALGLALLGHAAGRDLGIASFVSLGNRADVSTNDLLELWEDDERVAAITLYVESFGNPQRFSAISQRVSRRKPILAVKGNRRPARREDAESHTAAALSGESIVDALLRQAGVLRCTRPEELFDAAELVSRQPLPGGRRVAILTNSGGLGTLAADAAATRALELPELAAETQERLRAEVPAADRTVNPVDMGIDAGPDDYRAGVRALLGDDAVDAVLCFYVQISGEEPEAVLAAVAESWANAEKPVAASVLGADGAPARLAGCPVPNLRFPEACAAAIAQAAERHDWLARPLGQRTEVPDLDPEAVRAELGPLTGHERSRWLDGELAERLLASHGIDVAPHRRCGELEAAVDAAGKLARPVALKAEFPPPQHAADIDAVLLGLEGEQAVRAGWNELRRRVDRAGRQWRGAIVQPLIPAGADVLVGAVSDPELGPVIALGLGGRQAGLSSEVGFRLATTLTDVDVDELIASAPAVARHLAGFRGGPPLDQPALRELIGRFARLLETFPEIAEVDLNPVRVLPEGCCVLDLRIRAERRRARGRLKTW